MKFRDLKDRTLRIGKTYRVQFDWFDGEIELTAMKNGILYPLYGYVTKINRVASGRSMFVGKGLSFKKTEVVF